MALIGDDNSSQQSPIPVPTSAESALADALRAQFPGGDRVTAIVVVSRRDGDALSPADLAAVHQGPLQLSNGRFAGVAVVPMERELSGFALNDAVGSLRNAGQDGLPGGLRAPDNRWPRPSVPTSPMPSLARTPRCWRSPRRWWHFC